MTTVHLCRRFWPDQGGVETHVERVCKELVSRRNTHVVIALVNGDVLAESSTENVGNTTRRAKGKLPAHEVRNGIAIYRIGVSPEGRSFNYKLSVWKWLFQNFHILKSADIIQVHDVFWWILPLYPWLRGKVFTTFHGYEPPGPPTTIQKLWHRLAAACSVGTMGIGSFHQKWYGVVPDAISFGAVDAQVYSGSVKQKKVAKNQFRCMYLGRVSGDIGIMEYLQGFRLFLEQMSLDKDNQKNSTLDVYGSGELLGEARLYAKNHKLPVTFHGSVPNAARLARTYDLVFASSYLAILEMLSIGKPIIAYYGTDIKRDYLLDNTPFANWIFAFNKSEELAELLSTFVNRDHVSKQPPKAAQTWARQQTWAKLANQYQQIWA